MRRKFLTLDVFTDRRFTGNPLAVVLEPDGLDTATMQSVAREFGHPETVFVFAPVDPAHRARLRIFTPARELPFAGHPTVGTAVLLARLDGDVACELVLEEAIGPVRCRYRPRGPQHGYSAFDLPRLPERLPDRAEPSAIAAALGLVPSDLGFAGHTPSRWTAGNPFTFVPVHDRAAVTRARPDLSRFDAVFGENGPGMAFVYCRETAEPGRHFHARMFAPGAGVPEDPATGSAAAAFAGLLAAQGDLADGEHKFLVEQGYAMGRPSLIEIHLTLAARALVKAAIGGEAVVLCEGHIEA